MLYSMSTQRLIAAPIADVWSAWADPLRWSQWVMMDMTSDFRAGGRFSNGKGEGGMYKRISEPSLLMFTWDMSRYQSGSSVEVYITEQGDQTLCRLDHVALQHIDDMHDAEVGWAWAMDSLKTFLETGAPLSWEQWEARAQAKLPQA